MSILTRYLVRQNIFLVFTVLMVGIGLFLLTDLIERLEDFLDAGLGLHWVVGYFLVKIPGSISQMLPAVFLLALVVQLNILERSRELVALQAGGISPWVVLRFVIIYGLVWAVAQLLFSQFVGVMGDRTATRIWQEQVRGRDLDKRVISGLWFSEGNRVVHINAVNPRQGNGTGLLAYTLGPSGLTLDEIVQADSFNIENKQWKLHDVVRISPTAFKRERAATMTLPLRQNLKAFEAVESGAVPTQMPFWELGAAIKRLQTAGSNVEGLRTAWHGKFAYALSIAVMGLLGLAISQGTSNVYRAVGISLLLVFLFYCLNTVCNTMGSKGMISPLMGAWFADAFWGTLCLARLMWPLAAQRLRKRRVG